MTWRCLLAVIVVLFIGIFELGGRQHLLMRDMINKKADNERVELEKMIFGNKEENVSGGIIIGIGNKWLLIWEKIWPKLYRFEKESTEFYFYEMCSEEMLKRADNLETITLESKLLTIDQWKAKMPRYGIVWLKYDRINKRKMIKEIYGYEAFFVKEGSIRQQCGKL